MSHELDEERDGAAGGAAFRSFRSHRTCVVLRSFSRLEFAGQLKPMVKAKQTMAC